MPSDRFAFASTVSTLGLRSWALVCTHAGRGLRSLVDGWAPRLCALCELPLSGGQSGVCDPCLRDLPGRTARRCPVCALAIDPQAENCPDCEVEAPVFDAAFALADYAAPVDRALVVAKFHGRWPLLRALGAALAADCRARTTAGSPRVGSVADGREPLDGHVLVPIPLSIERLTERGYNQAAIIARAIARDAGGRLDLRRLARVRDTARQSALHRADREVNLLDAFRCRGRLDGRDVVLIDDVMTTGATLNAAARTLREAGARRIVVLVVARTRASRRPARE